MKLSADVTSPIQSLLKQGPQLLISHLLDLLIIHIIIGLATRLNPLQMTRMIRKIAQLQHLPIIALLLPQIPHQHLHILRIDRPHKLLRTQIIITHFADPLDPRGHLPILFDFLYVVFDFEDEFVEEQLHDFEVVHEVLEHFGF